MRRSRYTIFLPVRNGGEYVKQCVESILAQTHEEFELVALENCSTDGTAEWLAALNDPRIKVRPAPAPLSMLDNFSRSLTTPSGEFMTFIGHDDLLAPNYLEVMDRLISAHPAASLYQVHFNFIDPQGGELKKCAPVPPRETLAEFLVAFFANQRESYSGYMYRPETYRAVGGFPPFRGVFWGDDALWILLIHQGYKVTAPEVCFSLRSRPDRTTGSAPPLQYITAMADFIVFLNDLKHRDAEVAQVIDADAPTYFGRLGQYWYRRALSEATVKNQPLDPAVRTLIENALAQVAPNLPRVLGNSRTRRSEFINRTAVTRSTYTMFKHGMYKKLQNAVKRRARLA